ncbi:murein biosynthesis integral membrane protein MurJ, partial [Rahnella victoriana]|uniref:murein biosynthesis integral membrane protein MurJ n=1 Tax=Rahnella victoriana TaxID=1510570 RepID=UPI00103BFBA0
VRKAILTIISGNFLSKILGLVREMLVAALFGTGNVNAAYRVAQTGTLVPINFLTGDSLSSAFVPLYKKYKLDSHDRAQSLVWGLMGLFSLFSILLVCFSLTYADNWAGILAPGLNPGARALTVQMLIVMALCIPFYLLSALLNYISMANDDYAPMSIRASAQNLGMLIGALFSFYLSNPIYLAWGFTGGYIIFSLWAYQRAFIRGLMAFPSKFQWALTKSIINEFWKTLRPLILLPIILQGNIVLERSIASLISLSAVSAIDYAKFITETIIFLLSVPVAFAGLTSWSGKTSDEMKPALIKIFKVLAFLSIPASMYLGIYATSIVQLLFSRGDFKADSVIETSNILIGMSFGLWGQVIGYVFIKALNAQFKNKSVLGIMLLSLAGNAAVNVLLYHYLGALTLGLGISVYGIIMLVCTLWALNMLASIINFAIYMIVGSACYFITTIYFKFFVGNVFVHLLLSGVFMVLFWSLYLLVLKDVRSFIKEKVFVKLK